MDWQKILTDNFGAILAIAGTLSGVAIGYWGQSVHDKKQREWSLDDQRRQWKRDQLIELRNQFNNITAIFAEFDSRSEPIPEKYLNNIIQETSRFRVKLSQPIEDENLRNLVSKEYFDLFQTKEGEEIDSQKILSGLRILNMKTQFRIEYLIQQTYDPEK